MDSKVRLLQEILHEGSVTCHAIVLIEHIDAQLLEVSAAAWGQDLAVFVMLPVEVRFDQF
jgi:hypothetical protein